MCSLHAALGLASGSGFDARVLRGTSVRPVSQSTKYGLASDPSTMHLTHTHLRRCCSACTAQKTRRLTESSQALIIYPLHTVGSSMHCTLWGRACIAQAAQPTDQAFGSRCLQVVPCDCLRFQSTVYADIVQDSQASPWQLACKIHHRDISMQTD